MLAKLLQRARLTPMGAGLAVGLLTGIADAIHVQRRWHWEELGAIEVRPFTFLAIIWTWITLCGLIGIVFAGRWAGRARAVPLMLAGPGLLLAGRGAHWILAFGSLPDEQTAIFVAIGIALVLSVPLALIGFRESRPRRLEVVVALISFVAVVICAFDLPLRDWLPARKAAADGARRNVVLVFVDTIRYDDALGPQSAMPRLAAFAREAVRFDNAWAPAAWTIPSHHAVMTGANPWTSTYDAGRWRYLRQEPLLSEVFQSRGYATAAIFSNGLLSREANFAHGFDRFDYSRSSRVCRSGLAMLLIRSFETTTPVCGRLRAPDVIGRARNWIARQQRPYFLAMNTMETHGPYPVGDECPDLAKPIASPADLESFKKTSRTRDPAVVRRVREQHRAAARCLDRTLGAFLGELGRDPNTVIAVVGDHGEQFGEHGLTGHGNSVYRQVLHVPLIVKAPRLAPARIADAVSIIDVHGSLRELAAPARMRRPAMLLDAARRRRAVSSGEHEPFPGKEPQPAFSAAEGNFHLIRWKDGREVMYDHTTDPEERTPLAPEASPDVRARLRALVLRASISQTHSTTFDALGYLNQAD